jgi:hypothetical protein
MDPAALRRALAFPHAVREARLDTTARSDELGTSSWRCQFESTGDPGYGITLAIYQTPFQAFGTPLEDRTIPLAPGRSARALPSEKKTPAGPAKAARSSAQLQSERQLAAGAPCTVTSMTRAPSTSHSSSSPSPPTAIRSSLNHVIA